MTALEKPAAPHASPRLVLIDHVRGGLLQMMRGLVEVPRHLHHLLPSQPPCLSMRTFHQPVPDGVDQMGVHLNRCAPSEPHVPLARRAPLEIRFSQVQMQVLALALMVPCPLPSISPSLSIHQPFRRQEEEELVGRSTRCAPSELP